MGGLRRVKLDNRCRASVLLEMNHVQISTECTLQFIFSAARNLSDRHESMIKKHAANAYDVKLQFREN
jgi:hypothetical protein